MRSGQGSHATPSTRRCRTLASTPLRSSRTPPATRCRESSMAARTCCIPDFRTLWWWVDCRSGSIDNLPLNATANTYEVFDNMSLTSPFGCHAIPGGGVFTSAGRICATALTRSPAEALTHQLPGFRGGPGQHRHLSHGQPPGLHAPLSLGLLLAGPVQGEGQFHLTKQDCR